MHRIATGILRHRKWVVGIFLIAALIGAVLQFFVPINYSLTDYLPEDAQSTKALSIMETEFAGSIPNARVMIHSVSLEEALAYKAELQAVDGVTSVLWLDDVADLQTPIELLDEETVSSYYRNETALFSVAIASGYEVEATDAIYEIIGEDNALSGDALNTATSQKLAGSETIRAMVILVPLILLILLLSTGSWLEPFLFLIAIGISVLINMGLNWFFGEISFVTQAVSPILQLAVSLDYAIFLLHSFAENRERTEDTEAAMVAAMKASFPAVAASAATTLFGFLALIFMDFRLGADLGINLVKGIFLSFLSVIVFLPALTLCLYRWIDRTSHRPILPKFRRIGSVVTKIRIPCLILIALIIVPCFLAQSRSAFTYGMGDLSPSSRSGSDTLEINETFGKSTPIVLLVPRGEVAKEEALSRELESIPQITQVVSYTNTVGAEIPPEYLGDSITGQFYSENYCRMILYADTETEGDEAFSVVQAVQEMAAGYYGDTVYSCGESVNLYDMKNTVTEDNRLVNLLAIVAIGLVLLVTFRSLSLPLLLLLTIETAIWINLSIPYFMGSSLCYVGYLVINTVQLGATVDYAILFTENYQRKRKQMLSGDALKQALTETFPSILVSASILSSAGFCLYFTSSNTIVSQLGLLLGRGTLLSLLLVVCFLPAILRLFDWVIEKTTIKANYYKERSKR